MQMVLRNFGKKGSARGKFFSSNLNKQNLLYYMKGVYNAHRTFHHGFLLGGQHSVFVEKDISVSCLQCVADLILRIPDVHVVTHDEHETQEEWHRNGVLHRDDDLPALIIHLNGEIIRQEWQQYGKLHREGGFPAVIWDDGGKEWWQNGVPYRENDLPHVEWGNDRQIWLDANKEPHRDGDLPAYIWYTGTRLWYQHGKLHRDNDQPATIWADGVQEWYQHGRKHRIRGPAVINTDGSEEFWEEGVRKR